MPFRFEQLAEIGQGKRSEFASSFAESGNVETEKLVAFAVLSGPGFEEAEDEERALAVGKITKATARPA